MEVIHSAGELPDRPGEFYRAYIFHSIDDATRKHRLAYGGVPDVYHWQEMGIVYIPIQEFYSMDEVTVYSDGGCSNNQDANSRQAYGSFAVEYNSKVQRRSGRFQWPGKTNNEAEYLTLLEAFNYICDFEKRTNGRQFAFTVKVDSMLVVRQMSGEYSINYEHLRKLNAQAKEFLRTHPNVRLEWIAGEEMKRVLGH